MRIYSITGEEENLFSEVVVLPEDEGRVETFLRRNCKTLCSAPLVEGLEILPHTWRIAG